MQAVIISVGSELISGAKLDTNSQWLSGELMELGIPPRAHITIADHIDDLVRALTIAVDVAELVIITGGLGPTLDDITRDALAKFAGVELVLHEPSLEHIRQMFARRHRPMPDRNVVQAMFPAGSEPLDNPRGTAPGIWMVWQPAEGGNPRKIIALPGVPSEMKYVFRRQVVSRLDAGDLIIRRLRINCFGVGESQIEELLGDLTARGRDPEVGITAHEATITLRITAIGHTVEECREKIERTRTMIVNRLGTLVYGEEDEELEHAVVRLLNQRRASVATAESGTGGLLAHRLTGAPGYDACYLGGVVVPSNSAKRELVYVDPQLLATAGPISAEVAGAMAEGCRKRFATDYALAVTEWSQFGPDDPLAPVPASYVALATPAGTYCEQVQHVGDPEIAKSRTAKTALNLLRLHLIEGG